MDAHHHVQYTIYLAVSLLVTPGGIPRRLSVKDSLNDGFLYKRFADWSLLPPTVRKHAGNSENT